MQFIEEVNSSVTRGAVTSGFKLLGNASKSMLKWGGVPIAALALGVMSEYEHRLENERLKKEFQLEIATKTGKKFEDITVDDLRDVAKENPILQEALDDNAKRRNLNMGVSILSTVIAYSLATAAAAALVSSIPVMATMFVVGFGSFVACEKILNNTGKNLLGMESTTIKQVEKDPARQWELSTPDQIRYLSRLQEKRLPITPEMLVKVFRNNEKFDQSGDESYSYGFNNEGYEYLPGPDFYREGQKEITWNDYNAENILIKHNVDVNATAELLNSGRMRAAELAFMLEGQASGVQLLDTAPQTRIEVMQEKAQATIAAAQEQAALAQEKVVQLTGQLAEATQAKLQETKEKADTMFNRYIKRPPVNPKDLAEARGNQKLLTPEAIIKSRALPTTGQNVRQ